MRKRSTILFTLPMLLSLTPMAHAVTIRITYTDGASEGFNDPTLGQQRRNCFEAAVSQWSQSLSGSVAIDVEASFDSMGGLSNAAVLGHAGPIFARDFQGAPQSSTWYPTGLANQFAGADIFPANSEIIAEFNSDVDNQTVLGSKDFYYGTDGNAGTDADFYSVVLHEMGHGLGFINGIEQNGAYLQGTGIPVIYDRFLANGSSSGATLLTSLSQSSRASALISNALFFSGTNTRSAGGGVNAQLYAPNPYESGSSTGHLDENTYSGVNELMTPIMSGVTHQVGAVATGIFKDIGWTFNSTGNPPSVISITPSSGTNTGTVSITDLVGTGFSSGASAKLTKSGESDIAGTSVSVVSSTKITCVFDLTGKTTGQWNVVVTNADSLSGTLTNGFTINGSSGTTHDLALTSFSVSPTSASRRQRLTFSYTVKNQGTVSESSITFRMSEGSNVLLTQSVGTLAAGAQKSTSFKVKVPGNATKGDHFLTGEVVAVSGETDTSNNKLTTKVTVN